MTDSLELTVSRTIHASAKKLFEAWLDPKALAEFMRPMPEMTIPEVSIDPKEGGSFKILMRVGETDIPHDGIYRTIDRYKTLAFTWNSPFSTPGNLVTITFAENEDGSTEVTLHHREFKNEESRDSHEKGWGAIVQTLGSWAA